MKYAPHPILLFEAVDIRPTGTDGKIMGIASLFKQALL
jgi:hypothetical protein